MISAGIRDLKNNLSRYIRRLSTAKRILITDRGRVVAELRLPEPEPPQARGPIGPRYQALIDAGVIRPAIESGDPLKDWPTAAQLKLPPGTAQELIDADRDEP
jgi:antitoxin (DNA-binding transcriptional repressor) of toxin-antitoxin stability system